MKKKVPSRHYFTHPGATPETFFFLVWPYYFISFFCRGQTNTSFYLVFQTIAKIVALYFMLVDTTIHAISCDMFRPCPDRY